MHTGGPGDDDREPAGGDAPPPLPARPTPVDEHRFPIASGDPVVPRPAPRQVGARDGMRKFWIGVLIVLIGIPVGLFIFGALLFGACLLGR